MREVETEEDVLEAAAWVEEQIKGVKDSVDTGDNDYLHIYMGLPDSFPGEIDIKALPSDSEKPEDVDGLVHARTDRVE